METIWPRLRRGAFGSCRFSTIHSLIAFAESHHTPAPKGLFYRLLFEYVNFVNHLAGTWDEWLYIEIHGTIRNLGEK
ncbi:uncharacterized protein METZ01_LOCUS164239 [marine metagenome]|uniref:Uncharacterized protein n=1 Tax=marine metagenome TaxID=408172 RepID=A0A382BC66_9ZZZZ